MDADEPAQVEPTPHASPSNRAADSSVAPTFTLAALLGAASALMVPLVALLVAAAQHGQSSTLGQALSRTLAVLISSIAVFVIVQALAFRSVCGRFRPRAYLFPAVCFLMMLALSYPSRWVGLADHLIGQVLFSLVVGAASAVLLEAALDDELEPRARWVMALVVVAATVALVGPPIAAWVQG